MLKQRTYVIMTRPCLTSSGRTVPIDDQIGLLASFGGQSNVAMYAWTEATAMPDGLQPAKGCWVEWYRTRSYIHFKREMRKLLKTISRENVLTAEIFDTDTAITPQS